MPGRLRTGTSGFAYPEWKPEFYPADLKNDGMLAYYAGRLRSVEINYTFYREPSQKTIAGWVDRTPESFRFALKANQKITHVARLGDVDEVLGRFLETAARLGERLGPILFQCPPTLRYDADLLDAFLARLPGGDMPGADRYRFAMEFRHASWESDEAYAKLGDAGVAWCVSDTDERDAPFIRTSRALAYLRLRKLVYEDDALKRWAGEVATAIEDGADVYAFFKHEDTASGALYAMRFAELAGA